MTRALTILGAVSSIGIKPYDDGTMRWLDRAPATLRSLGIAGELNARDAGDVEAEPYRDFERVSGTVRNEPEVVRYSHALADRVATLLASQNFPVVLGGDCSILLGCLLGVRRAGHGCVGLVYLDAHADFATPSESATGSAASMDLALAVGRGDSPLAALDAGRPLVKASDVALVGRRDHTDGGRHGEEALAASAILDLPFPLSEDKRAAGAARVLERVARVAIEGFWIHVDADVLSPAIMPAVDSPEPGGPDIAQLAEFLAPLVAHPKALGLQLTIYDPRLDPDLHCGRRLVALLRAVFVEGRGALPSIA